MKTKISRIIIFANGELPNKEKARALLHKEDFIIAADGGTRHALALGRMPNVLIGDLDSVTDEERRKMKDGGVDVVQFPADKNETDLELAIQHALTLNPQEIIILAALGGRLDQTLGNIALISDLRPLTLRFRVISLMTASKRSFFAAIPAKLPEHPVTLSRSSRGRAK
ncbi:MAG: thiamine diphosphokinase [Anaerolineales bacterium]|nr:thiamine diphosphokinase [Anaerolineales bacterium]